MADRVEATRALAKVLAYQAVGKVDEARAWFERLAAVLGYKE